jgi:hypothetical protein
LGSDIKLWLKSVFSEATNTGDVPANESISFNNNFGQNFLGQFIEWKVDNFHQIMFISEEVYYIL